MFFSSVEKDPYLRGVINPAAKDVVAGENCPYARFNISESKFQMSIVATEFPQQNLGIDDFLFTCIVVPTPQHGNEIPTSLCRNFIPTSLCGNEIPTKWCGN